MCALYVCYTVIYQEWKSKTRQLHVNHAMNVVCNEIPIRPAGLFVTRKLVAMLVVVRGGSVYSLTLFHIEMHARRTET